MIIILEKYKRITLEVTWNLRHFERCWSVVYGFLVILLTNSFDKKYVDKFEVIGLD